MTAASSTGSAQALRRAFLHAPRLRRGLSLTLALALSGTGLQIVAPILVQQILDRDLLGPAGPDAASAVQRGLVALGVMAVSVLLSRQALVRLAVTAAAGLSDLRVKTFGRLHRLSVLHVESERRGALVARVTSDVSAIQDFMDWGGVGMLIGGAQVVLAFAAMIVYQWQLALVVGLGATVYTILLLWFQRILQRAHDRARTRVADTLAAMSETITGLSVIRAHGAEDAALNKVENALARQFKDQFRADRLGAFLFSSAELFAGLITAAVVGVGIWLGAAAGLTPGTLVAFLFLVTLLVEPIQTVVETLNQAQMAASGMRRVLAVLETALDIDDPVDPIELPKGTLGVTVTDLRFRYPTGDDVLRGISVEVLPGERIAIVGETGSGKTTFAKVLVRLLDPQSGTVTLGGVPVDRVRLADLRSRVGFVPQHGFLFDTTIGENVRYGKPDASEAELTAAFDALGLGHWLEEQPLGLDEPVGERGSRLSAGERQLVALARAVIADPDVLVLDEATSAVDPHLEVRLRRAIERISEHRTTLTIAHRLSTAEAADRVLVFADGHLAETGTHRELIQRAGVYAALHADWSAGTAS